MGVWAPAAPGGAVTPFSTTERWSNKTIQGGESSWEHRPHRQPRLALEARRESEAAYGPVPGTAGGL